MCYRCAVAASTWRCAHPAVKTVFAVPAKLAAAKAKSAQWRCLVGGGTLAIMHAISPDSARRQVGQDDRVALAGYLGCLDCYAFAAKEIALSVVGKNMSLVGSLLVRQTPVFVSVARCRSMQKQPCFSSSTSFTCSGLVLDTLGFEPRAFRMRSGCDATTPCAPYTPSGPRIYGKW